MKKWIWLVVILLVLGIGYWVARELTKPLPGQEVKDDGREHVTDIYGVKYSSNPPTSGKHFPVWAKPGVYDRLVSDGYLLHSMEHGYVVIWYDCSKLSSGGLIKTVFAHDEPTQESTESYRQERESKKRIRNGGLLPAGQLGLADPGQHRWGRVAARYGV